MADIFELHAPLKHKAKEVSYDNTSSGLSALNVKTAIDELAAEHTGSGENNTASNIGVGGIGLFKQKVGVNLEFKNINSGSSKITVTNDAGNNELDLDVNEANVIHDSLSGAGANTHAQIDSFITGHTHVEADITDLSHSAQGFSGVISHSIDPPSQEYAVGENILQTWDAGVDTHIFLRKFTIPKRGLSGWISRFRIEFNDATTLDIDNINASALVKGIDDITDDIYIEANNGKKVRKVLAIVVNNDAGPATVDIEQFSWAAGGIPIGSGAPIT